MFGACAGWAHPPGGAGAWPGARIGDRPDRRLSQPAAALGRRLSAAGARAGARHWIREDEEGD
ncbi:hypothetical protein CBM2606_A40202 [Cupriavidus taiwanensis]|nr:hypothetical protein CBM2606_A40202 [Cupriavidus taiwanensis]